MTDILTQDETPSEISGGEGNGLLTLPDGRSIAYKPHPLAELFPMMSPDEHAALVTDIRERGVQRPIVLLDGMVLDGRNRYMAARDAEVGYRVVDFTGDDPLAFVISENMRRRHLTDSQRAMVAAKIAKLPKGANQHAGASADLRTLPTTAAAAEQMNVPLRTVEAAKTVVRDGAAELVNAVETGNVSVTAAAQVAKLPEAEQQEIVAQGPEAVRAAAKAVRQPQADVAAKPEPKKPGNGLSNLSREALEDEVIGLREENADWRKKHGDLRTERDDLKARLAEATSSDQGKTIGALQKQLQAAKFSRDEALAATKRMEFKLRKAEARVKELEETPIDMGQP